LKKHHEDIKTIKIKTPNKRLDTEKTATHASGRENTDTSKTTQRCSKTH
jgi:hypothetical protein